MNIEEMKPHWQSAQASIHPGEGQAFAGKRETSLQRLVRRYRALTWLPLAVILANLNNIGLFHRNGVMWQTKWHFLTLTLMMALCAAQNRHLMKQLASIDPVHMPVRKVLDKIKKCRKSHLTFAAFGMPCALLWALSLAYCWPNTYFRTGIMSGCVIGLIIGLRILHKCLRDYREVLGE